MAIPTTSNTRAWLIDRKAVKSTFYTPALGFGLAVVCGLGLVPTAVLAAGPTIHVDQQISSDSCTNYNPSTQACGGGADTAYKTIAGASAAATAGTTVLIRAGSYTDPLIPQNSGAGGQYITFKNYGNEDVFLGGETG